MTTLGTTTTRTILPHENIVGLGDRFSYTQTVMSPLLLWKGRSWF